MTTPKSSDSQNQKSSRGDNGLSESKSATEENMEAGADSRKLAELLKGIRFAMLTTSDPDGLLRSRPMATQDIEFDGKRLWFFTGKQSGKVTSINANQHVNVAYSYPEKNRYVSVSGQAQVIEDRAKIKELWSPAIKAWFPDGPESPEVCLLAVDIEKAEYWDVSSSKLIELVGFAKAILTGQRYKTSPEEHQKLNIGSSH